MSSNRSSVPAGRVVPSEHEAVACSLPVPASLATLREDRAPCKGRRNWLFVGSQEAAEVNTTFVSLLASCQMHAIEPCGYLRDLFCLLPSWPARRVLELLPPIGTRPSSNRTLSSASQPMSSGASPSAIISQSSSVFAASRHDAIRRTLTFPQSPWIMSSMFVPRANAAQNPKWRR